MNIDHTSLENCSVAKAMQKVFSLGNNFLHSKSIAHLIPKLLLVIFASLLLISCTNPDGLLEEWKIDQIAENEGGGPIFVDANTDKTIRFFDDGTVEILNGDLCWLANQSGFSSGTVDFDGNHIKINCYGEQVTRDFTISTEDKLYLVYPGLEISYETYVRSK